MNIKNAIGQFQNILEYFRMVEKKTSKELRIMHEHPKNINNRPDYEHAFNKLPAMPCLFLSHKK